MNKIIIKLNKYLFVEFMKDALVVFENFVFR